MAHREYHFWVYILPSRSRNLYTGMTNNLIRRVAEHRENKADTYTARYVIHRLAYFEYFQYVNSAIAREKELKHWTRKQKIELIEKVNPTWGGSLPGIVGKPWNCRPKSRFPTGMTEQKSKDQRASPWVCRTWPIESSYGASSHCLGAV